MELALPQSLDQWLDILVPLVTIGIGLVYLAFPGRALAAIGIGPTERHQEAVGEGRSRFAGFALGTGACALLFGQPVLMAQLGLAYSIAGAGRLIQILVDRARSGHVFVRFILAAVLAMVALRQAGLPEFTLPRPQSTGDWLVAGTAAVTAAHGMACLLVPRLVLATMRLQSRAQGAGGELRGLTAGLQIAAGALVLADGGIFAQLALGAGWLATACGRMISMLSERANNLHNWSYLLAELILAGLPFGLIFGVWR